jgi:hypothetical protein
LENWYGSRAGKTNGNEKNKKVAVLKTCIVIVCNNKASKMDTQPDLQIAFEQLDRYALDLNMYSISDLLHFRTISRRDLETVGTLHKIQPIVNLQAFLFQQYFYLLMTNQTMTLVFIGSGDAVLEIYVALHALENFASMGHHFNKFRVILSDIAYREKPHPERKSAIELIFGIAQSVCPELQLVWNEDILDIFPQLDKSDNYKNTLFLAFNLSMPSWEHPITRQWIDQRAMFVQKLMAPANDRFKESRFISCSSMNPDRNSKMLGIWVYSDSLKNFAAKEHPPATNIEALQGLHSCIQCNSEIHGVVWSELHNPQRIFCGKECQKVFWSYAAGSKK